MKYVLGEAYCIKWLDHYSEDNENSEEACRHKDTIIYTYGKCVGITPKYIILAYNYENEISNNNDNMHIMKCAIVEVATAYEKRPK